MKRMWEVICRSKNQSSQDLKIMFNLSVQLMAVRL